MISILSALLNMRLCHCTNVNFSGESDWLKDRKKIGNTNSGRMKKHK
ncbi:hypothetical protein OXIME_001648 [Oxyplasma meridianum]|uniref:Uncharacterized protein n=1 Tax=Oxyplasma meridianum TaxID=3073602 RepID=A0AAX4NJC6_9ARCH